MTQEPLREDTEITAKLPRLKTGARPGQPLGQTPTVNVNNVLDLTPLVRLLQQTQIGPQPQDLTPLVNAVIALTETVAAQQEEIRNLATMTTAQTAPPEEQPAPSPTEAQPVPPHPNGRGARLIWNVMRLVGLLFLGGNVVNLVLNWHVSIGNFAPLAASIGVLIVASQLGTDGVGTAISNVVLFLSRQRRAVWEANPGERRAVRFIVAATIASFAIVAAGVADTLTSSFLPSQIRLYMDLDVAIMTTLAGYGLANLSYTVELTINRDIAPRQRLNYHLHTIARFLLSLVFCVGMAVLADFLIYDPAKSAAFQAVQASIYVMGIGLAQVSLALGHNAYVFWDSRLKNLPTEAEKKTARTYRRDAAICQFLTVICMLAMAGVTYLYLNDLVGVGAVQWVNVIGVTAEAVAVFGPLFGSIRDALRGLLSPTQV